MIGKNKKRKKMAEVEAKTILGQALIEIALAKAEADRKKLTELIKPFLDTQEISPLNKVIYEKCRNAKEIIMRHFNGFYENIPVLFLCEDYEKQQVQEFLILVLPPKIIKKQCWDLRRTLRENLKSSLEAGITKIEAYYVRVFISTNNLQKIHDAEIFLKDLLI